MNTVIKIISLVFLFNLNTIYSNDMWQFEIRKENEHYYKSEFFEGNKVVIVYKNKEYGVFKFNEGNLNKLSNSFVSNYLGTDSDIYSKNNSLIVSSGNNLLFEYKDGEWNSFQFEDRFNHKDSLEMRRINKIVELDKQLYCFSYAYKLKSLDTLQSGTIEYRVDTTYNEIFKFEDNKLDLIYSSNYSFDEKIYDITSDNENIWSIGDKLNKYGNNLLLDSYDIISLSGLEENTKIYKISSNENFVYLLKGYDSFATIDKEPLLIKFNKDSKKVSTYKFPLYESYGPVKEEIFPTKMNDMVFVGNMGFISTNKGIYKFDGFKIEYFDVFGQFLSDIPEVYLPYLSTSDISVKGSQIAISTNVGLIYTDTFTNIKDSYDRSYTKINLYPNVFNSSDQEINLKSNIDINVEKIAIYESTGKIIQETENINKLNKGLSETIEVDLSSGMYFLAVISDEESFIYPIIINK